VIIKNIIALYGVSDEEQKMFYNYLLQKKGHKTAPMVPKKALVYKDGRFLND
jgi:hypothetical protein